MRTERDVTEDEIGTYRIPVLELELPQGQVVLEPMGQDTLGSWGRFDLYAYPSLYRVMLLRRPGVNWTVRTESGINWPHPWQETTFVELAEGLAAAT